MNEKALQILEQYDLEVLKSYGGRGGIMLCLGYLRNGASAP